MNFFSSHKSLRKNGFRLGFVLLAVVAGTSFIAKPTPAEAQFTCLTSRADPSSAADSATKVPVTESTVAANTGFTKQKGCLLDSLAQAAAKVVLQQMTSDIVNWINTGFQGNPAFLTNPEGFFLDMNDQLSGAFLAHSGALSQLCSPFNLDIRLNLAMLQSQPRTRYTCTLSTIINNFRNNKPRINVGVGQSANGATIQDFRTGNVLRSSDQLSINGQSAAATGQQFATMEGFVSGDFAQGGWPAFISMTSDQQNNVMGAWLAARSDLQSQLAAKQAAINRDLDRGQGFLSWQQCKDGQTFAPGTAEALGATPPPGTKVKENKDGSVTYQTCSTETPGSFISSSLFKQTNSSVDQIVNIHDINDAINQVAQALVLTTLKTGLATVSQSDSRSDGLSPIDRMTRDIDQDQRDNIQALTRDAGNDAAFQVASLLKVRQDRLTILLAEKTLLDTAYVCLSGLPNTDPDSMYALELRQFMTSKVNKELADAQRDYGIASTTYGGKLNTINTLIAQIQAAQTTVEVASLTKRLANMTIDPIVPDSAFNNAEDDLAASLIVANSWHTQALKYQSYCSASRPPSSP